jgi:NADPH:quinone reductase-like Zn-dependent oxidoreductase
VSDSIGAEAVPTMNAVQVDAWGDAGQLQLRQLPRPTPGPGEVLVRILFASVNAVDKRIREGYMAGRLPLPYTAGSDFSGIIHDTGEGADLAVGTAVFGGLWPMTGACADYIVFPAADLAVKPDTVSFEAAAALPIAGLTAQVAIDQAAVRPGQRVLVQGAGGGVGHLALQLAKLRGAYVIGTSSALDQDFVRSLGADEALDYRRADQLAELHDIDVVIDGVSAANIAEVYPAMRPGAIAISLFDPPTPPPAGIRAAVVATTDHAITRQPLRDHLTALIGLVARGRLKVIVSQTYTLEQAGPAQDGRKRGKVVIAVSPNTTQDFGVLGMDRT